MIWPAVLGVRNEVKSCPAALQCKSKCSSSLLILTWCQFSNNILGKKQNTVAPRVKTFREWIATEIFYPQTSTVRSWWEVRDCKPAVFKNLQSCEKICLEKQGRVAKSEKPRTPKGCYCPEVPWSWIKQYSRFWEFSVTLRKKSLLALTVAVCHTGSHSPWQAGVRSKLCSHRIPLRANA